MNLAQSVIYLFPNAKHTVDFIIQDDSDGNGAYIAVWNIGEPQPTKEELEIAWDAYQLNEASKPIIETDAEKLNGLLTENDALKAETVRLEDDNIKRQQELLIENEQLGKQLVASRLNENKKEIKGEDFVFWKKAFIKGWASNDDISNALLNGIISKIDHDNIIKMEAIDTALSSGYINFEEYTDILDSVQKAKKIAEEKE